MSTEPLLICYHFANTFQFIPLCSTWNIYIPIHPIVFHVELLYFNSSHCVPRGTFIFQLALCVPRGTFIFQLTPLRSTWNIYISTHPHCVPRGTFIFQFISLRSTWNVSPFIASITNIIVELSLILINI